MRPCQPFYPYEASKLAVEEWLRAYVCTYNIDASMTRAFVVYGAGENPFRAGARDFVPVDDVVIGLLAVAQCGELGAVYNLGSGQGHSLRSLIRIIEDASGRAAAVEIDDKDLTDSYPLVTDIARLHRLGFIPSVILAEGVAELVNTLGPAPALPRLDTVLSARLVAGAVRTRPLAIWRIPGVLDRTNLSVRPHHPALQSCNCFCPNTRISERFNVPGWTLPGKR